MLQIASSKTAPIAKLGQIKTPVLFDLEISSNSDSWASVKPVVPTTTRLPNSKIDLTFENTAFGCVKSSTTSGCLDWNFHHLS